MLSQSELIATKQLIFFEDPDECGELRTKNLPPTQEQRPVITNRVKDTPLKADVRMVSCIHGRMSDSEPTSASLVVFEYHVGCMGGSYRCTSLKTRLAFTSYGPEGSQSRPLITAYEPSRQLESYAPIEVEYTKKRKAEGSLGARFAPAEAGITLGGESEEKYKSLHYASFEAFPESPPDGTPEPCAVEWQFRANEKTQMGIPDTFRVALLIERKNLDKFKCTFTLKLHVGRWIAASNFIKKVVGRPEGDDPIIFNPLLEPQGEVKGINASSLGEYKDPEKLRRLTPLHLLE